MATRVHVDFELPTHVSAKLKAEAAREGRRQLVLALFKRGSCSAGVAAKTLGMRLAEFLELLKAEGLYYADDSEAAAVSDLRIVRAMKAHAKRRSRVA